ncbi:low molecular weight phosphotyrosine protein phosphatase [Nocardioides sp. MAH-18]|uniref:protein-tyrosine-phosphatase n=1 Tax=Nocardioides agri TaxID=2682843 RepID=A0A6L6XQS2_9ACTN|nr:low molecular weight protein-tyrosine-phosphatase [Nocardioides sp. CGMCC 1.13656]MBA2954867.1 low molecular weight phosphotyrosine protein phosphatase [Nocardioides sp. CGMCC 1.13656]MVQ49721.1 low molecular weight phosphotyrosine protein phosphatase [Nocardioides sp. MAH-18]
MLPPARSPGRYRVELVCLGNICRSPTAHVVVAERLADAGLDGVVTVTSSGTGDWHVGGPMDRRAAATLTAAGYDASRHRARLWETGDELDLVLAMDDANLADLGGRTDRVRKFRDLDPVDPGSDVPDPYYGGPDGFEEVLAMVERTAAALVGALEHERPWEAGQDPGQP